MTFGLEVITNSYSGAFAKELSVKPVSCITLADFSCEFRFVDVEAKSGAPNAGKYDEL